MKNIVVSLYLAGRKIARTACLLFLIALPTQPHAASMNYLVINVNGVTDATAATVSIATTCPAGYQVHYYGIDDAIGLAASSGGGANNLQFGVVTGKVCIAGTPSTANITPSANTYSGCITPISVQQAVTLSAGSINLKGCSQGGYYFYSVALVLPDGFVVTSMVNDYSLRVGAQVITSHQYMGLSGQGCSFYTPGNWIFPTDSAAGYPGMFLQYGVSGSNSILNCVANHGPFFSLNGAALVHAYLVGY